MQWVAKAVQTLATGWHGLLGIGIFMLVISGFIIVNTMVSYFSVKPKKLTAWVVNLESEKLNQAELRGVDLHGAYGHGAVFFEADLRDANLSWADFQRSIFRKANMESVAIRHANLDYGDFQATCLRKGDLSDADLDDADFRGAYLGLTRMKDAILKRAKFQGANLMGVDLDGARLPGARFDGAILTCLQRHKDEPERRKVICASLRKANLVGAVFFHADLRAADLQNADMTRADLRSARLEGANFSGVNLAGALLPFDLDLDKVQGLTQAQLEASCFRGTRGSRSRSETRKSCLSALPDSELEESLTVKDNPCYHEIQEDRVPMGAGPV